MSVLTTILRTVQARVSSLRRPLSAGLCRADLARHSAPAGLLVAAAVVISALIPLQAIGQEADDLDYLPDNAIADEGTEFLIEGTGISVAVVSTQQVNAFIEVLSPEAANLHLEASTGPLATVLTITGLVPDTVLHKYLDGFDNHETITTDSDGACSFLVDSDGPVLVMIRPEPSTIYLTPSGWSRAGIGTWDPNTRTGTLTTDVFETIQVSGINVTLYGNGHTVDVSAIPWAVGVFVRGTDIRVSALNIRTAKPHGGIGVKVHNSDDVSVAHCVIEEGVRGVMASNTSNLNVSYNTLRNYQYAAINIFSTPDIEPQQNHMQGNQISGGAWGIILQGGDWTAITTNTLENTDIGLLAASYGCEADGSDNNFVAGNTITGYGSITLNGNARHNTIKNNDCAGHLYLYCAFYTEVFYNVFDRSGSAYPGTAFYISCSDYSNIYNNDFISSPGYDPSTNLGCCYPVEGGYCRYSVNNNFDRALPYGGNYWSGYTGTDADGDGIGDTPYVLQVSRVVNQDVLPYVEPGAWEYADVFGTVSSDCLGGLSGIQVDMMDGTYDTYSTTTDSQGRYLVENVRRGSTKVTITVPEGFEVVSPAGGEKWINTMSHLPVRQDFVLACVGITPVGNDVVVLPKDEASGTSPVTLAFDEVTQTGVTTLDIFTDPQDPPQGFRVGNPHVYYEITTSAVFTGSVEVCIEYENGQFKNEDRLKIFHAEGGDWIQLTEATVDTVANVICATTTSFSQFVLFEEIPFGHLAGYVQDSETGAGLHGVVVDLYGGQPGSLVDWAVTDADGHYEIRDHIAGAYTLTVVLPLGYGAAVQEVGCEIVGGQTTLVPPYLLDGLASPVAPRSMGFWKHQVGVALSGNGQAQVGAAELCGSLDLIEAHFNSNAINEVVVYDPPADAACVDKLGVAGSLLNLHGSQDMIARARQQLLALLLNVASGRIGLMDEISANGATVSQAITWADHILDDPQATNVEYETVKNASDGINMGLVVAAGVIPLDTVNISYRSQRTGARDQVELMQNLPNPFNPATTITFNLPRDMHYTLTIYDAAGRLVRKWGQQGLPGLNTIVWNGFASDGSRAPSGVYLYRLQAGGVTQTERMTLLK